MQNLIFCLHNVVLDRIILAFIYFWLNFFSSKTLKIPISFVWGVYIRLDLCLINWKFKNLKYQHLKNLPKTKSLLLFLYQLWKTAELRSFCMHCKCKERPTFGALSNQGLCHLCSAANTTEIFFRNRFRKKTSNFLVLWKNTYHTIFIYGKMFIIEVSYNLTRSFSYMEIVW